MSRNPSFKHAPAPRNDQLYHDTRVVGAAPPPPPPPPPPAPLPPPPPPPPPSMTYPAAVVLKGYQPTYDYINRVAPTPSKVLTTEVNAGHALPTGWVVDPAARILFFGDNCEEGDWNLLGWRLYNQAGKTVKLYAGLAGRAPNLDYMVRNGADNGGVASVLEFHGFQIDGAGQSGAASDWSTVNSSPGASFRSYDTNWINADYRFFSGEGEFYRDYFGKAGQHVTPITHVEQLFLRGSLLEDCFLDATGSAVPASSGNIQVEAGHHIYRRVIMRGARDLGAFVAVQGSAGASFDWTGCIVDPGKSNDNSPTGGYLAGNGSASSTASGNIGYVTTTSIDSILTI